VRFDDGTTAENMSDGHTAGTVLVVDDDPSLTEVYAAWLASDYRVRQATSGEEALDELDGDVDVVLLDRRMPGLSGREVLETIREAGYGCRVAMVTGVRPDDDIVEMGFDEYLLKPAEREDIHGTVEDLLARSDYDDQIQELYALASKRATLAAERERQDVEPGAASRELEARIDSVRERIDAAVDAFEHDDFRVAFRDIDQMEGDGD
jgi:DNA-binding response OmpR family regulator